MTGYVVRKYVLFAFVAAYSVVAVWGGEVSPRREFFPVFNWSLFTHLYPMQNAPELYVLSIGGRAFPKPVNYFELGRYFESARMRSSVVPKTLLQLSRAVSAKDAAEVARLRAIIETRHLAGHGPVEYEVRNVRFMAVERWKDRDRIIDQQVVGRFTTKGDP
jgi:hypothetical protein